MTEEEPVREPMSVWEILLIALECYQEDVVEDTGEYDFDKMPTSAETQWAIEAITAMRDAE